MVANFPLLQLGEFVYVNEFMNHFDAEPRIGIAIPAGKHIRPVIEGEFINKGFKFDAWQSNGRLHVDVANSRVTLTLLNQPDIINQVRGRYFEAGIVGSDVYAEYLASLKGNPPEVEIVYRFDGLFNPNLRLSLLVRDQNRIDRKQGRAYRDVTDLRGQRVVTGYPCLTEEFFRKYIEDPKEMPVIDGTLTGKEEGQVAGRRAEAAVVIVDTGVAIRGNHLRESAIVMRDIQPVLFVGSELLRNTPDVGNIPDVGRYRAYEQFMHRLQNGGCRSRRPSVLLEPGNYSTLIGSQPPAL